jgi:phosphoribosylanthranilate isomerase
MIVQIYEIQEPMEAERCVAAGVDHVGSVLVSRDAWREPSIRDVVRAVQEAGRKHALIPLFADPDLVSAALEYYRPDLVHFCDSLADASGAARSLDPFIELQQLIKERFPAIGIMRSIPVAAHGEARRVPTLEIASALEPASDWFLIDTWVGADDAHFGITGIIADWGMSRRLVAASGIPVILAGGLSPENVAEAIRAVRPAGVDSCTQTNAQDGEGKPVRFTKDLQKVARFVEEARRASRRSLRASPLRP